MPLRFWPLGAIGAAVFEAIEGLIGLLRALRRRRPRISREVQNVAFSRRDWRLSDPYLTTLTRPTPTLTPNNFIVSEATKALSIISWLHCVLTLLCYQLYFRCI